ncbi:peptide ABC transporter substrate-binding protein [Rubrivivax rivuli]|uniref:Peptide ABC transporter substrate-binding protein n=1 Tax=Rubrivivax rivuli TaxID=1862385 RepID=A0A437REJ9_9BURK|nr:peptide ABC transporter substrate-binding protein [Rubrivivax rivuli]RVU45185.1 peptide ABC transporter substrate-binding protein [Rubrivivax rivuli]
MSDSNCAANEATLRTWLAQVQSGQLPRRAFVQRLAGFGIAAPLAGLMLWDAGVAQAQPADGFKPTQRGGGGLLRLLEWQGPTLLNPHFATGLKDNTGARIFYEPLAEFDAEGNLSPVLAAEVPSRANGGLAADGKSVVWKLKRGVTWHDGQPFTADDVVFNWQYATDPATAAVTAGNYEGLKMEKVDTHTVRVVFDRPRPFWPGQYAGVFLIPRHLFAAYSGNKSREAPNNNRPVGTGPYTFVEFRPADLLRGALNRNYHLPNRPYFDSLELKAGGDATSAARAVLQTGDYDFAGGLSLPEDVLVRLETAGKGRLHIATGSATQAIYLNFTDPAQTVDGERSHAKTRHPIFSEAPVREAIGHLIDRAGIQRFIYGRQGQATSNFVNNPARYRSPLPAPEYNIEKAKALLDAAGWKPGPDGVRVKNGRKLNLLFQGAVVATSQSTQAVVKQAAGKAGIQLELKAVPSSVFFSSDTGNPDTYGKFYADMQTYNWTVSNPDPENLMQCFVSWEVASQANKWLGQNMVRWQNAEYDTLYRTAQSELDPVKRAALFIRMNDLVVKDGYVIPLLARNQVAAMALKLVAPLSPWRNHMASLAYWHKAG